VQLDVPGDTVHAIAEPVQNNLLSLDMLQMVAWYMVGYWLLTVWDEHGLSMFLDPVSYKKWTGMTHPKEKQQIEANAAKLKPATVQLNSPLPSLEELADACHRVGTSNGWAQYLCLAETPSDWCRLNDDFTAHYGVPCYVCQRQR